MIIEKERLKELELIFNLTKDIVIVSEGGQKLVDVNIAFFEFFNQFKTLDDFNKNHNCICEFFEKIDKDGYIYKDNETTNENWMEYISKSQGKELIAIIKNSNIHIFNIRVSVLNKEKNKYIITMSDITASENENILLKEIIENQKKYINLEEEYKYSTEMLNFIFNAQNELLVLTDGKDLKDTNRAMLEFSGFKSVAEFHKEHDCVCDFFEEGEGLLQSVDKDGISWIDRLIKNINHSAKVKMKSSTGEMRTFNVSTSAMKNEQSIYLITFSDITELLLKENALIKQSKKALMGEMIDAIAHQWKQPLSILQTNMLSLQIKMELDKITDKDLKDIIDVSNEQTKHMSDTIDEFRGFFRPHNIMKFIYIKELIKSVLILIKDDLVHNAIEVKTTCDDSIKIECVPNELKHVLINILNNAKDAFIDNNIKKNRKIEINISKDEISTKILIQDNAGGIPDAIINNIFDENFSTKHYKNGSGIGLYMSKMIIEKINGNILVYNTAKGACFSIVIPELS